MFELEPTARAVLLTDGAGAITTWNAGCGSMFGLTAEQVLGRSITTLFTQSGRDAWSAGWAALAARLEGAELHLDLQCGQGRVFAASLALAPQFDAGGALLGCAVAVTTEFDRDAPESEHVARTPLATVVDAF